MGVPHNADAAIIAYNEMLASIGALAFVGVAIAIGAQAVAGEEQDCTLHLVLAAPVSRVAYLLGRGATMVLLLVAGAAVLGRPPSWRRSSSARRSATRTCSRSSRT